MSMCYFAAYAVIPSPVVKLDPNGLPYRAAMKVMGFAGPVLQAVVRVKHPLRVLWFEKLLTAALGREVSMSEFLEVGERVYNLERLYNLREGLDGSADRLPARLLHEPTFEGATRGVPLEEMLRRTTRSGLGPAGGAHGTDAGAAARAHVSGAAGSMPFQRQGRQGRQGLVGVHANLDVPRRCATCDAKGSPEPRSPGASSRQDDRRGKRPGRKREVGGQE
jgi:hypothetical protein